MKSFLFFLFVVVVVFILFKLKRSERTEENREEIKRVKIHPIEGNKPSGDYIRKFKTKVVGVTFPNLDGSSRQKAIKQLRPGQKVQLVWNPSDPHDSNAIMVAGKGDMNGVDISTCVGHLKADLAADVIEWINDDKYNGIYAEVSKILGGTKDLPTLGCLIEITLY